jgi:hypothetical protein
LRLRLVLACSAHEPPPLAYTPRDPTRTALYRLVADQRATFAKVTAEQGHVPSFVNESFERFLRCGGLACGFAHYRCTSCQHDHLVPRSCKARGLCPSCGGKRTMSLTRHVISACYEGAVTQWVGLGPMRGRPVVKLGTSLARHLASAYERVEGAGWLCARLDGFDLHGRVAFGAADRKRLEELVRYCARPPLAYDRLTKHADGRYLLRMKARWRDGTTHLLFEPIELMERSQPERGSKVHYQDARDAVVVGRGIVEDVPGTVKNQRQIEAGARGEERMAASAQRETRPEHLALAVAVAVVRNGPAQRHAPLRNGTKRSWGPEVPPGSE